MPPLRLIAPPLQAASRTKPHFTKAPLVRNQTAAQAAGRAYEKKVATALGRFTDLCAERNPWFTFEDARGTGLCSPDLLLFPDTSDSILVIEVKRTWVPEAGLKLQRLYCPIVRKALGVQRVFPVVICKYLTSESANAPLLNRLSESLTDIARGIPVFPWLGEGVIPW